MREKMAIIDIGSNTIRLVINDFEPDKGMKEIENIKTVARLRTYLNEEMVMEEEGIVRLIDALQAFKEIIAFHELTNVRLAATAAVRQAANQEEIISRVKEETGYTISVLSEEEEAYFGYLAIAHSTPVASAVTVDIGGGSTEVTYFEQKQLLHSHSFPFGVVSLKNDFMKGDQMTVEERKLLAAFLKKQFSSLPWLKGKKVPIVAIGGSARNIAQIDQQMKQYPIAGVHQYWMEKEALFSIRDQLVSLGQEELARLDGLSGDRVDIIAPASEVFCQLFQHTEATGFMFSRKGLREGIVMKELLKRLVAPLNKENVFQNSLRELTFEYAVNKTNADHMMYLATELYEHLCLQKAIERDEDQLMLLKRGAYLYYLGEYIDSDSSSQHTFYIIANRSIDGMLHRDRIKLAAIASFKNKAAFKQYMTPFEDWFTKEEMQTLRELGSLLKFVYSLNGSKRNIVKQVTVKKGEGFIEIHPYATHNPLAEEYQANKQKKHLEKAIKRDIKLHFHRY